MIAAITTYACILILAAFYVSNIIHIVKIEQRLDRLEGKKKPADTSCRTLFSKGDWKVLSQKTGSKIIYYTAYKGEELFRNTSKYKVFEYMNNTMKDGKFSKDKRNS